MKNAKPTEHNTVWRDDPLDQLRHSDATPAVLRTMEDGVAHIWQVLGGSEREIARLRSEVKALKALLRQNGITVPRSSKTKGAGAAKRSPEPPTA